MLAFFWSAAKAWTRPLYQFYIFVEKIHTVSPSVEIHVDNELKMAVLTMSLENCTAQTSSTQGV